MNLAYELGRGVGLVLVVAIVVWLISRIGGKKGSDKRPGK